MKRATAAWIVNINKRFLEKGEEFLKMNPMLVLLILLGAAALWALLAFAFPSIGYIFKEYYKAMKGIMSEDEDEE